MLGINFQTELQEKAKKFAAELYHLGFNIETVITFPKGTRILFKTLQEDRVTFTHYFIPSDYNSGVQLSFVHVDGKLTFKRKGVFDFRDSRYDTPENNKTLETLIKIVEANILQ